MVKHAAADTYSVIFAGTTAATTTIAGTLDCQDADYASIVVTVSAEANTDSTNVVIAITESADTVVTNFATHADMADHQRTIDNTAAAIGVFHVSTLGRKRYLRVLATPDTTTNGAVIVSATGQVKPATAGALAATATAS